MLISIFWNYVELANPLVYPMRWRHMMAIPCKERSPLASIYLSSLARWVFCRGCRAQSLVLGPACLLNLRWFTVLPFPARRCSLQTVSTRMIHQAVPPKFSNQFGSTFTQQPGGWQHRVTSSSGANSAFCRFVRVFVAGYPPSDTQPCGGLPPRTRQTAPPCLHGITCAFDNTAASRSSR